VCNSPQGQKPKGMARMMDHEPTGVRLQTDRDIALNSSPIATRFPSS